MYGTNADQDLDVDSCLFLDCGYIESMESLDGITGMKAHYEISEDDTGRQIIIASRLPLSLLQARTLSK